MSHNHTDSNKGKEKRDDVLSREEISKLPEHERLKFEIAEELGLYDKVLEGGWRSLTAQEAGRIGGLMTKRRKIGKNKDINKSV